MNRKVLFAIFALTATACAKHVRTMPVTGPDGKPAVAMRCGTMAHCYAEAGRLCPNGYVILDDRSTTSGTAYIGGIGGGGRSRGSLFVSCK